jgi:hypothetical protein
MTSDVGSRPPSPSQGPQTESTPQVAKKCLKAIETYRKGPWTPLTKAAVIQDVTTTLTSTTPQFTKAEVNDALGLHLKIISWCDWSAEAASGHGNSETNGTETLDKLSTASKWALSVAGIGKKQKPNESDFP